MLIKRRELLFSKVGTLTSTDVVLVVRIDGNLRKVFYLALPHFYEKIKIKLIF